MSSIYSKDGYLYLQYSELLGMRRVRRQVALRLTDTPLNRKKAEIIKNETEVRLNTPKEILSYHYPLEMAFNEFIQTKKTLSKSSRDLYRTSVQHFIDAVGNIHCSEVSQVHVNDFYDSLEDFSPNTKATYTRYLIAFFEWLKKKRYVKETYFTRLRSTPKKIRPMPDELFEEILNQCSNENQWKFLKFLWLTGFRKFEAIQLKWQDIDFEQKIIYVKSKGGKTDQFPLFNEIESLLSPPKKSGSVFGYKSVHSLKFWRRIKNRLGHDYTIHDIRKTFASKLVENDVSVFDACKLLRHSSVKVTERYYTTVSIGKLGQEAERVFGKKSLLKVVNLSSQK